MNKKEELKEDLERAKDLVLVAESKGGKLLRGSLMRDIMYSIDSFVENRSTLTHNEFIALACDIKSKRDVLKVLSNAKENEKFLLSELKGIEEALES